MSGRLIFVIYVNPIFTGDYPDPSILRNGDDWIIFKYVSLLDHGSLVFPAFTAMDSYGIF